MRILFLDIDGVLNSNDYYVQRQELIKAGTYNVEYPLSEFDPKCMKLLDEFCGEYDIKIVISSTWRLLKTIEDLQKIFNHFGHNFEIIDKTPDLRHDAVVRGNEILWWMKQNKELIQNYYDFNNYIILDDDSDMLLWQKDNFIKVDRFVGITPQTIFKMKKILHIFENNLNI